MDRGSLVTKPIRIKFLSKTPLGQLEPLWSSILPDDKAFQAVYTFDPDDRNYDFLVIYEDLPPLRDERKIFRHEVLACSPHRTLLIMPEPSSIRLEGLNYMAQYGYVWTSRKFSQLEKQFLRKRKTTILARTPPLRWFYGRDMEGNDHWPLSKIEKSPVKTADLSTITSNKAMRHTLHEARLDFIQNMKNRFGDELTLFGRGFDPVRNKAKALAPFRYHIAIENHLQPGHHTEKLTDCILAECLCFYYGDPDYKKTYPSDPVIPIDIRDPDGSEIIIQNAIANDAYRKRLPYILKAKKRALKHSNTLRAARQISAAIIQEERGGKRPVSGVIEGRHLFRRNHPIAALRDAAHNIRMKTHPYSAPKQD